MQPAAGGPLLGEAARVWFRISLRTFGGPAGQIAVMHRELVEERRWIGERRFLHAVSFCTLLPGPEAQQLAIYLGWLLNGTLGGLIAGALFVLPGYVALMALSAGYAAWGATSRPGCRANSSPNTMRPRPPPGERAQTVAGVAGSQTVTRGSSAPDGGVGSLRSSWARTSSSGVKSRTEWQNSTMLLLGSRT